MSAPDATQPVGAGTVLCGRYRLVRPIAQGGMASVWEAHDNVLARPVAVKMLHPHLAEDRSFLERFRQEAVSAARLAHPNVVATFDAGVTAQGTTFIVMELIRGRTLSAFATQHRPLPIFVCVEIAMQIADALAHAHGAGLIHRDIKPANVLVCETETDGVPQVKVTDFGIAKAAEGFGLELTKTGMILGTPRYLSPEQVDGRDPDARADLYALGVVLFELVAGVPPFRGPTEMAVAVQHLNETPARLRDLRPTVPPALDSLVAALLAKRPQDRPPSAAAVRQALSAIDTTARQGPGPAGTPPSVDPTWVDPVGHPVRAPSPPVPTARPGPPPPYDPSARRVRGSTSPTPSEAWAGTAVVPSSPGAPSSDRTPAAGFRGGPGSATGFPGQPGPATGVRGGPGPATGLPGQPGPAGGLRGRPGPPGGLRGRPGPAGGFRGQPGPVTGFRGQPGPATGPRGGRPGPGGRFPASAGAVTAGTVGSRDGVAGPGGSRLRGQPPRRKRPNWAGRVVAALVVAALVVLVLVLVSHGSGGSGGPSSPGGSSSATPIKIEGAAVFHLERDADHAATVGYAIDGNPDTSWESDLYHGPHFANLRNGLGLAFTLGSTETLHTLAVSSSTVGWSAEVYVADAVPNPPSLAPWGLPVDSKQGINGSTTFDLQGQRGSAILLWITDLGPTDQTSIAEVTAS